MKPSLVCQKKVVDDPDEMSAKVVDDHDELRGVMTRLLMVMVSLEVSGKVRKALSLPRFFAPPQDFQRGERKNGRINVAEHKKGK